MKSKSFLIILSLTMIMMGFIPTKAKASLIYTQETSEFSFGNTNNLNTDLNTQKFVFVSGFDSNLGTLASVSVDFTSFWILGGSVNVSNFYNCPRDTLLWCKLTTSGSAEFSQALYMELASHNATGNYTFETSGYNKTECIDTEYINKGNNASTGCSKTTGSAGTFSQRITDYDFELTDFIGGDNTLEFSLYREISKIYSGCTNGNRMCNTFSNQNKWSGAISVTYGYEEITLPTSVSEPSSFAILAFALLGLTSRRLKRLT